MLREAPDALVVQWVDGGPVPVLAVEFSASLSAGNQAWQRAGRAYSIAAAGVPYAYLVEVGGVELDAKRNRKAVRSPNPVVPFSYLSLSWTSPAPVLPVFTPSPAADLAADPTVKAIDGSALFTQYVGALLERRDASSTLDSIYGLAVDNVAGLAEARTRKDGLSPNQWRQLSDDVRDGGQITTFLKNHAQISWRKIATIKSLTASAKHLMEIGSVHGLGLTSGTLPFCFIPAAQKSDFTNDVQKLYTNLSSDFLNWLRQPTDLTICWIMGFKPKGDDARPDRGLPPFARMLVGPNADLLTVVYGPAPAASWETLENDPKRLAESNGLWEAILRLSNGLLIDSATDHSTTRRGYVEDHWQAQRNPIMAPSPTPTNQSRKFGEQDVDTAIHLLVARALDVGEVFEGMCNPPGGDWSGLSLLDPDSAEEFRWVSLPRVSGADAKRPDHVFQIFDASSDPLVVAVESKDFGSQVEDRIGPRLNRYIRDLMAWEPSAVRSSGQLDWARPAATQHPGPMRHASVAAFLYSSPGELRTVTARGKADLGLGLRFANDGSYCELAVYPTTRVGAEVGDVIERACAVLAPLYRTTRVSG